MKKTSILALLLAFVMVFSLFGCTSSSGDLAEYLLASEASDDVLKAANETLSAFMQAFEENNPSAAMPLFSESVESTEADLAAFFESVSALSSSPFVPFDAYYLNNLQVSDALMKVKKSADAENYIEITPAAEEMYCAMYVSEGDKISHMMTILMVYEGADFKIVWVNPTDFEYSGRDALEIYETTKKLSDDGRIIPAYISSCMLSNIFQPGGFFRYKENAEMEDICYKLFTEISETYKLPLALENTNNSSVYEIGISNDEEYGVIPLILIKTDEKSDLEKEAKAVVSSLDALSPGISDTFDYVHVEMTNDDPANEEVKIESEKIVIKTK